MSNVVQTLQDLKLLLFAVAAAICIDITRVFPAQEVRHAIPRLSTDGSSEIQSIHTQCQLHTWKSMAAESSQSTGSAGIVFPEL